MDDNRLICNNTGGLEEGDANYMDNTKSDLQLEQGDTITPIYKETDLNEDSESTVEGKSVKIKNNTTFEMKALPKGYYVGTVVITDPRGDSYYSAVVGADIDAGGVKGWKKDARLRGSNY